MITFEMMLHFVIIIPYIALGVFTCMWFIHVHPYLVYRDTLLEIHQQLVEVQYQVMKLAHYYGAHESLDYDACAYYLAALSSYPDKDVARQWVSQAAILERRLQTTLARPSWVPGLRRRLEKMIDDQTLAIQTQLYILDHTPY